MSKSKTSSDNINHPSHYTPHPLGVKCIDIVEHMNFNVGCAIRYLWQADSKGNSIEDLRRAAWFVGREISRRRRYENGNRVKDLKRLQVLSVGKIKRQKARGGK